MRSDETEQDAALMNGNARPQVPIYTDMLVCYGSLPGFVTNREPTEGSWYINALYDVFLKHAHETNVESMLKKIGDRMNELYGHKKGASNQIPAFTNFYFCRELYFQSVISND